MTLKPGETHWLHGDWYIVQRDGWYETASKSGNRWFDFHDRTEGFYAPPVKGVRAAVSPTYEAAYVDSHQTHKDAMLNDQNYRRWYESGGLRNRSEDV